jgi:predicted dehydrogenase
MNCKSLDRREFLKQTALTVAGLSLATRAVGAPRKRSENDKINCVMIGCGGRSMQHMDWLVKTSKDNIYAIVDPDEKQHAKIKKYLKDNNYDPDQTQVFTDYRRMYEKVGKNIDAVVVAAPNHHHFLASAMALQRDIAVYCEKPLTHDIAQARTLRAMARKSKSPAQMGNQGHCEGGYHRLYEYIQAGVVGPITETHHWTNRANGGEGPRPPSQPVPAGLNWDNWIGPAPFRNFHEDLHPHEWHGWYDFGNGSLGNMGCHVLDGVFWAMKIEHPTSIEAEEIVGGSKERYPIGSRLRYDIPAREGMPAFKAYWYEGIHQGAKLGLGKKAHAAQGDARNYPAIMKDLLKQYPDEEIASEKMDSGSLYIGEKGVLFTGTYGNKFHLLPLEKWQEMDSKIPRTLPRPKTVMTDFLDAIRAGRKETFAHFEYGAQLTEFTLLGNLAQAAGVGQKVEWDGPKMRVKNIKQLNDLVKRPNRKGWSV